MASWAPGDLAMCINDDWDEPPPLVLPQPAPKRGGCYHVADLWECDRSGGLFLELDINPDAGWNEKHFTKIEPLSGDEISSFFVDLLTPVIASQDH